VYAEHNLTESDSVGIINMCGLNAAFFAAGGRFAVRIDAYLSNLAKENNAIKLYTTQKTKLANYIALMTELLVELCMIVTYEVDFNSITRSDAAGVSPVTLNSYETLKSIIVGNHVQWVPEICFRIKEVWMQRIQICGSSPGMATLPTYFYPVMYRNLSVAEILTRIDTLAQYTDGFFQANELKVLGRPLTWVDVIPKEALPGDSSYATFIFAMCPILVDNGGVEASSVQTFKTTTATVWKQDMGIDPFWDIACLWGTSDSARTNLDWHCLKLISVADNKCSLSSYQSEDTAFNPLGETATELRLLQCGAAACVAAGSGTLEWGLQYTAYWSYRIVTATEAAWNILMNASIYQMLAGRGYMSSRAYHDSLPTIRTLEEAYAQRGPGSPAFSINYTTAGGSQQSHSGDTQGNYGSATGTMSSNAGSGGDQQSSGGGRGGSHR
jgi:uncharacterized membrane protein YgcG